MYNEHEECRKETSLVSERLHATHAKQLELAGKLGVDLLLFGVDGCHYIYVKDSNYWVESFDTFEEVEDFCESLDLEVQSIKSSKSIDGKDISGLIKLLISTEVSFATNRDRLQRCTTNITYWTDWIDWIVDLYIEAVTESILTKIRPHLIVFTHEGKKYAGMKWDNSLRNLQLFITAINNYPRSQVVQTVQLLPIDVSEKTSLNSLIISVEAKMPAWVTRGLNGISRVLTMHKNSVFAFPIATLSSAGLDPIVLSSKEFKTVNLLEETFTSFD